MKMKSSLLGALLLALTLPCEGGYQSVNPREAASVLAELPPCSRLRQELESTARLRQQEEQPYMRKMRALGVERVFVEVHSVWRHNAPTDLQFTRQLYFREYDGPDSIIMDPGKLKEIVDTGLQSALQQVAEERVRSAHLYGGVHGVKHPEGKSMSSRVEFFATPFLREENTRISPLGDADDFVDAAALGDLPHVRDYVAKKSVSKERIERGLFYAVMNSYDNSSVIRLLVSRGADVNSHSASDGATPLIRALIGSPCNVAVLLDLGARSDEKDKWGRTALLLAQQENQTTAANMILSREREK